MESSSRYEKRVKRVTKFALSGLMWRAMLGFWAEERDGRVIVRCLADYEPLMSQAMELMAKETRFTCHLPLGDIFQRHSRLIVAINHGSPLSWLPAVALLATNACARGGGSRVPLGVMDRAFFHIPIVKELARMLTQTEQPITFEELAQRFSERGDIDLVVFPEGSNCFFGRPDEIQEFRSPKFVELAIRTGAPILICAHYGSEKWAWPIKVPGELVDHLKVLPQVVYDFLEKRIRQKGLFALPLPPLPMEKFVMRAELYHPRLKERDLSQDPVVRKMQISQEAERVRAKMREMHERLKAGDWESPIEPLAEEEYSAPRPRREPVLHEHVITG